MKNTSDIRACVRSFVRTCVRVYVRACVRVYVRACVSFSLACDGIIHRERLLGFYL